MKYIDAEKLIKAIEEKGLDCSFVLKMERLDTLALIDELQQDQREELVSDDLEEAAREIVIKMHPCLKDCTILGDRLTRGQLMALVKAGAEWQKRKMIEGATYNELMELYRAIRDELVQRHCDVPVNIKEEQ